MFDNFKEKITRRGEILSFKLSWKMVLFIGLLIIFVTVAISYPIYWQTRQGLENQLTEQLRQNINLIKMQIDPSLLNLIIEYPELHSLKDSLKKALSRQLELYSVQAIYLIDSTGLIIVIAGNQESALKSTLVHAHEIANAADDLALSTPLFADRAGNYYKSAFTALRLENGKSCVIGLDASAGFLESTRKLRNQIFSVIAVILVICIGLVLLLARTLTRPLEKLTDYAIAIGQGRNDLPALRNRKDEIGLLGATMQKMHSALLQREKENKQFLASVAHEIRNPLGGMKINAELLLEETGNSATAIKYTTAIAREIERLSQIVESFLTYARPLSANLVVSDLNKLLNEAAADLKREFPFAKINISGQAQARINPGKIRHCLYNLLRNGLEAAPQNPQVNIELLQKLNGIEVRIFNPGTPIPVEIQSQIFEAFFSTKPDGVGLGLAIAKSLIEQHGGRIDLDHSDADGTEFVIILPE